MINPPLQPITLNFFTFHPNSGTVQLTHSSRKTTQMCILLLLSLIPRYVPARALRSSSSFSICVPPRKTTVAASKSFSSVAPNIWNALSNHLSSIPTLPVFRRALKHHLFPLAYPDSSAQSGKINLTSSMYHTSWYSANYCHCAALKHHVHAAHLKAFHAFERLRLVEAITFA